MQGRWFSHLTQLRTLKLRNGDDGQNNVLLSLNQLPAQLRYLSVEATTISVDALPCTPGTKLTVQLTADRLEFRDPPGCHEMEMVLGPPPDNDRFLGSDKWQGFEVELELKCESLNVPIILVGNRFDTYREATAYCLMRWLLCSGAYRVSLAFSEEDGEMRVSGPNVFNEVFSSCYELAEAIDEAREAVPALLPVFTCALVCDYDDESTIVEFVRIC